MREDLERRVVLSASSLTSAAPILAPILGPGGTLEPENSPSGFTPAQIRAAYGIGSISLASALDSSTTVAGTGAGQTIAIVDAYDDPAMVDSTSSNFSTSDLAEFDARYGLPNPPSFEKIGETGGAAPTTTDPSGAGNDDWEFEESLDVEWAHAAAPAANIILVECNSPDDLYTGVQTAAGLPGVSVISMSFGSDEYASETSDDSTFTIPNGHEGVTFLASTGDSGYPGGYPADSPSVVAVGGTSLYLNPDNTYNNENGWSDGGGGPSQYETEPSYQESVQTTGSRTIPDVSIVADPDTGVSIYDSYDGGSSDPWFTIGGTSLACPLWAGLISIADQGRVLVGGTTLNGPTQTLPDLYALPSTDFHDITSGNNDGETAGPGYDEVTGIGSPIANLLVPDLAYSGLTERLAVSTEPTATVTAGTPFDVSVSIENAGNQVDTAASGTVTLSLENNPDNATLMGTLTATISNGVATFNNVVIDDAADGYTLKVTAVGYTSVLTTTFDVDAGAAYKLVIATQPPSPVSAGADFGLTVDVEDAYGNLVTTNSSQVTLALATGPTGATLGGTDSTNATLGVATFSSILLSTAGTNYSITATDPSLLPATTTVFTVQGGGAASIVIESQPPGSVTAGTDFGLTVEVLDEYGNVVTDDASPVTISIDTGPLGAVLSGTDTASFNAQGLAEFSQLILTTAGPGYELQATSGSLVSSPSLAITVNPAAAAALAFTVQPASPVTAGVAFGITVQVEDSYGNLVTNTSTISLILNGPTGSSLGGTVSMPASGGIAQFNSLFVDKAGTHDTIVASDGSLISATSNGFTVQAGTPYELAIATQPASSVIAGQSFGLSVTVDDQYGNPASTSSGAVTISLASGPQSAALGGTLTALVNNGAATFTGLSLDTAATGYEISAHDASLTPATTGSFSVTAAAASQLAVESQPQAAVTAGAAFDFELEIEDQYGNLVTTDTQAVTVALHTHPSGATLAGTLSLATAGGVANFTTLALTLVGSNYSLAATASGLTAADSGTFSVDPAAPYQLFVSTAPPSSIVAGSSFGMAVAVQDRYGNAVSTNSGSVSLQLATGPNGTSLVGTTANPVTSGVASFSGLELTKTATNYTITATESGLISATTSAIAVTPAASAQLSLVNQPQSVVTAGEPFTLSVELEDQYGNLATTSSDAISLALDHPAGSAELTGTTTLHATSGSAAFSNLILDTAGTNFTLEISDGDLTPLTTTAVAVVAAAPAQVVVTSEPPATVTAGVPFSLQVQIQDQFGNATTASDAVSLALDAHPTSETLGGSLSAGAADGLATFSGLSLTIAGAGQTFEVSSSGLSSGVSQPITVIPAAASTLVVMQQPPAQVTAGTPFNVTLEAFDRYGNLATGDDGSVYASLPSNPSISLIGSDLAEASNGVIHFDNLVLDTSGNNNVLSFSQGGVTSTGTVATAVIPGPAAGLVIIAQPPSSVVAGSPFSFTVAEEDAFGNIATSFGGPVTLSQPSNPKSDPLAGSTTVNANQGVANFSGLSLTAAASGYTFQATGGSFSTPATNPVTITPAAAAQVLLISAPAATVTVNQPFAVSALVEDAYGNVDTSYSGSFTTALVLNPAKSKFTGSLTVAPSLGVATFSNLEIKKTGKKYQLQISTPGLAPVFTSVFKVAKASTKHAATAPKLRIVSKPPITNLDRRSAETHGKAF